MHPVALPGALGFGVMLALALALPLGHALWDRALRLAMTSLALALLAVWTLRVAHVLPWV